MHVSTNINVSDFPAHLVQVMSERILRIPRVLNVITDERFVVQVEAPEDEGQIPDMVVEIHDNIRKACIEGLYN